MHNQVVSFRHRCRALVLFLAATTMAFAASTSDAHVATASDNNAEQRNVAIVVHNGVELLDFAGPGEVFQAASGYAGTREHPAFNVYTVAPNDKPIVSQGFVTIQPEYTVSDCPQPDIIVIPGGGTGALLNSEAFMQWARDVAPECEFILSVCTGAVVLGDLGLLDGHDSTTHWSAIDRLAARCPKTNVLRDVRFVDSGTVVTSAGVSAGIDGALHVVARLHGYDAARDTARYMEYDWRPRSEDVQWYKSVAPIADQRTVLMRDGQRAINARNWDEAIATYRKLIEQFPDDVLGWSRLGYALHASGDLDAALEYHLHAAKMDAGRLSTLGWYNAACVYSLKHELDKALAALERAIETGFTDESTIRTDGDLANLRTHERYEALLRKLTGDGGRK